MVYSFFIKQCRGKMIVFGNGRTHRLLFFSRYQLSETTFVANIFMLSIMVSLRLNDNRKNTAVRKSNLD